MALQCWRRGLLGPGLSQHDNFYIGKAAIDSEISCSIFIEKCQGYLGIVPPTASATQLESCFHVSQQDIHSPTSVWQTISGAPAVINGGPVTIQLQSRNAKAEHVKQRRRIIGTP